MLQETRHVQSKVSGSGEVVWVCVHPANYLDESKRSRKKAEKEQNKLKIELSEQRIPNANMPKTRNPSKLKRILPNKPQLPSACLLSSHMKTTLLFCPL